MAERLRAIMMSYTGLYSTINCIFYSFEKYLLLLELLIVMWGHVCVDLSI